METGGLLHMLPMQARWLPVSVLPTSQTHAPLPLTPITLTDTSNMLRPRTILNEELVNNN